jgi:predicted transcriptional regulator
METQVVVRIPPDLEKRFARIAKSEGKTSSQVLRELMDRYVQERDATIDIDGLWNRMGKKLKSKGVTESEVGERIAEIRREENARRH